MIQLHSYPELLRHKKKLIEERKYFFKKYFSRKEAELQEMFSAEDKLKWEENRSQLHETTILIQQYRDHCEANGQPYV